MGIAANVSVLMDLHFLLFVQYLKVCTSYVLPIKSNTSYCFRDGHIKLTNWGIITAPFWQEGTKTVCRSSVYIQVGIVGLTIRS